MSKKVFASTAQRYLKAGYAPVPLKPCSKTPAVKGWQSNPPKLPEEAAVTAWCAEYGNGNIGILLGTPLANGRYLAAIDVDTEGFVPFAASVLGQPLISKVGSKGATFFCQADGGLKSVKKKARGKDTFAIEMMIDSGQVVIPPSIHPDGYPYRWESDELASMNPCELPVLDQEKFNILATIGSDKRAWEIVEGGATVQGHEPMLALTASCVQLSENLEWLATCLNALFHPDYDGNTRDETLGMLQDAKKKNFGKRHLPSYDPGSIGPIPLGYLDDGRFVFLDQRRSIIITETANRMLADGTLYGLAPFNFWVKLFPKIQQGKIVGFSTPQAADTLMELCRERGGFDTSRVRGRGVYSEKGEVVVNWRGEPQNGEHIYVCHLPLPERPEEVIEPAKVLEFFQLFRWEENDSEAYLLLGWTALAVICGALPWRPHLFLSGRKNSGKTTLVNVLSRLLYPIAITLDGQSTEAGIRQKLGADSRPVLLDEFESDQNVSRMKSVVKLIRSASSAETSIARGTPEGKALEFCIRSTFLMAAINIFTVTAADRSRIIVLSLGQHDSDQETGRRISSMAASLRGKGPAWCNLAISNAAHILRSTEVVEHVLPPLDSRHRANMAAMLAAAWVMLYGRAITEPEAHTLVMDHSIAIRRLAEVHDEDDGIECLNALLGYRTPEGAIGVLLGQHLRRPDEHARTLDEYGIKAHEGGFIVANSHPGIKKIFDGTLWAERGWVSALPRLPGASKTKQKRFSGGVQSLATFIPRKYLDESFPDQPVEY